TNVDQGVNAYNGTTRVDGCSRTPTSVRSTSTWKKGQTNQAAGTRSAHFEYWIGIQGETEGVLPQGERVSWVRRSETPPKLVEDIQHWFEDRSPDLNDAPGRSSLGGQFGAEGAAIAFTD